MDFLTKKKQEFRKRFEEHPIDEIVYATLNELEAFLEATIKEAVDKYELELQQHMTIFPETDVIHIENYGNVHQEIKKKMGLNLPQDTQKI